MELLFASRSLSVDFPIACGFGRVTKEGKGGWMGVRSSLIRNLFELPGRKYLVVIDIIDTSDNGSSFKGFRLRFMEPSIWHDSHIERQFHDTQLHSWMGTRKQLAVVLWKLISSCKAASHWDQHSIKFTQQQLRMSFKVDSFVLSLLITTLLIKWGSR